LRRDCTGKHEDAGADDGADTQGGEIDRAKRAFETVVTSRFGLKRGDALTTKQIHGDL
jgi:hypothetical protein